MPATPHPILTGPPWRKNECGGQARAPSPARHPFQKGEISPCRVKWEGEVVGGLTPARGTASYRPGPHAQIFYSRAEGLNYFFEYRFFKRAAWGMESESIGDLRNSVARPVRISRETRIYFFLAPRAASDAGAHRNRREIQGGGVVAGHDEEIDA